MPCTNAARSVSGAAATHCRRTGRRGCADAAVATAAATAPPRLRVHANAPAGVQRWIGALQRAWGVQAPSAPLTADALHERGEIGVWSRSDALPPHWQAWLRDGGSVLSAAK